MTYFIPAIGGPLDGTVLQYGKVPKRGYCEIAGNHCYEFDLGEWSFVYHPVTVIHFNGIEIRFGSHMHLCRILGNMAASGRLTWEAAADITRRNRAYQFQRVRILEELYREGAL